MDITFSADQWCSKCQWQHSGAWLNKQLCVWPTWDQGFNELWLIAFILLSNWLTCFVFYRAFSAFGLTADYIQFSGFCWENNPQPNVFPKKWMNPHAHFQCKCQSVKFSSWARRVLTGVFLGPGPVEEFSCLPLLTQTWWNCAMTAAPFVFLTSLTPSCLARKLL